MPEENDLHYSPTDGWTIFQEGQWWLIFSLGVRKYLAQFDSVTGTGSNQVFHSTRTDTTMSKDEVLDGVAQAHTKDDRTVETVSTSEIEALWKSNGWGVFPPRTIWGVDNGAIQAFLDVINFERASTDEPKIWDFGDKGGGKYAVIPGVPGATKITDAPVGTTVGNTTRTLIPETGQYVVRTPDGKYSIQDAASIGTTKVEDLPITFDETTGRYVRKNSTGSIVEFMPREYERGIVQQGGFNLLQQEHGGLSLAGLPPAPGKVEEIGGQLFTRGTDGSLTPLNDSLRRTIEQAAITGDYDKAIALFDFESRPTRQEYVDRALAYARSPADQMVVSAIARGHGMVAPPLPGETQRIGPQPRFLQDAFAALEQQMAGPAPAPAQNDFNASLAQPQAQGGKTASPGEEFVPPSASTSDTSTSDTSTSDTSTSDTSTSDAPTSDTSTSDTSTSDTSTSDAPTSDAPTSDAPTSVAPLPVANQAQLDYYSQTAEEDFMVPQIAPTRKAFSAAGGFSDRELDNIFGPSSAQTHMANGGVFKDNTAIVGEEGPELAIFPVGTQIIPNKKLKGKKGVKALKKAGVRGMATGGLVFGDDLPLGVRQLQAGQAIGQPRGQLFRAAGLTLPSAQAQRNLLPEESQQFAELGRLAGIPDGSFAQELALGTPSGRPRSGTARFLPLSLRR
jgi:hypothetical protein